MITVLSGPIGTLANQFFESRKLSQPTFSDLSLKPARISRKTLSLKMAQVAQNPCELIFSKKLPFSSFWGY